MAVEGRIDADDDWFVGEDRTLRFRFVEGATDGIEGWNLLFELYASRPAKGAPPLFSETATGIARTLTTPAYATVTVSGDKTAAAGPGQFQYVLSRLGTGTRSVLAFGPATIRSAVRP